MSCYMGLVIYAYYYKCDPVTRGHIGKSDQLLPYFVMHISKNIPGLPGLFVSGVFSAALSSMSTGLNSMTGVIFEDLIRPRVKKPLTEGQASLVMKIMVFIIGSICVALVFIVENIGSALVQTSKSLSAITAGPLLGIFTLGMFFPSANPKGALVGGLTSGVLVAWISIATHFELTKGNIRFPQKPVSVESCNADWLTNVFSVSVKEGWLDPIIGDSQGLQGTEDVFFLYKISYFYYTVIGMLTAIVIGMIVSYFTGFNEGKTTHKDLLSPVIHGFLLKETDKILLK